MEKFNYREYISDNPLLKEEEINEINVLDIIKKKIKKKYGVDASNDQIRFGDGTPISEESVAELNEILNFNKKKVEVSSISEGSQCSINEVRGRITEGLCNLGVFAVASILKSFPVVFSKFGPDYARRFVRDIFDGNSPEIMVDALDVEIDEKDSNPVFDLILFPTKQAFGLFTTMISIAIRIFQVASAKVCKTLIGVDSLISYIIDSIDQHDVIPEKDHSFYKVAMERLIKKYNNTGEEI